jgi:hypothetical protein
MKRARDWTGEEFETLLRSPALSAEVLAVKIPGRTLGAIEVVRCGIHEYHVGGTLALSRMMQKRLDERSCPVICSLCNVSF